ncbi:MAG TPA: amino acid adenylation domain-containing protein [Pyrinomonadaceae bacterium]|nr:amino acid adenylation domain-containing protein [Pyrinomonadaceae bacterium]
MSKLAEQIGGLSPQQRDLLALLLARKKREGSQITPVRRTSDAFPLSFAQQRLWFLSQLQPDSAVYNVAGGVRMEGPLDVAALERALNEVVARHESLRTIIRQIESDPVQKITSPQGFHLPKFDLRSVPEAQRETEAQLLLTNEARKPFNVEGGPLFRATLLLLSADENILLLTMHHIISDGWSIGILVRELSELYEAFVVSRPSRLAHLPVQYVDFAVWHREWLQGEVLDKSVSYWKEQLAGAPSLLELPTDRPRPPRQGFSGARQPVVIPQELTDSLRVLGEQQNATLFMALLAAFQVLLFRHAGQQDIVVGIPIAGRNKPELENVIGLFVNMLAVRTDLSGNPTFRDLLVRVREAALGAYEHQDLPFEKLVEVMQPERDTSYSPLFQVMFHLANVEIPSFKLPGLTLTPLDTDTGTSKFDLTLDLTESPAGLKGWIDYSTDLFDRVTIQRLSERFAVLLEAVVAEPETRISSLPLLSPAEQNQLVVRLNDTAEDFPQAPCLHQIFEDQIEQTPDATAVTFEGRSLTYAELNRRANQLAHRLIKLGVGPEVPVAICMERSLDLPIALMAVLKTGGAYVPLEPSYPRERVAFILEELRAPVVLTQLAVAEDQSFAGVHVISLDGNLDELATENTGNPRTEVADENLCYVIYTSGSTGQPKGAMLHHRGVRNRLLWGITDYQLGAGDVVLHKTPLTFDVSVWEIFAPLLSGARLLIAKPGGHQDTAYQLDLMAREKVTHVDYVPTMLEVLLESEGLDQCDNLKIVTAAGEALTRELRDRFYSQTKSKLYNLYGPTEASLAVTYWVCLAEGEERVIPIGRPMSNVKIYILDKQLQPVPIGVAGELHIGGVAPGRGYLKRPDLTADKFIPDAFSEKGGERLYKTGDLTRYRSDGAIEFLGRLDHQVKIRGMRMELGEVEAALCQHPDVREAVILAHEMTAGNKSLVAYVVSKHEPLPTGDELRNYLRLSLPEYMVPAAFMVLTELPLLSNGKLNRKALPDPEELFAEPEETYVAPESNLEQTIAAIWQQAFNVERVSIHSNFFDLGGNSLLLARIHSKLRAALQRDIKIVELFKHSTIHSLAKYLSETEATSVLHDSGREQADLRKKLMKRRRAAS